MNVFADHVPMAGLVQWPKWSRVELAKRHSHSPLVKVGHRGQVADAVNTRRRFH